MQRSHLTNPFFSLDPYQKVIPTPRYHLCPFVTLLFCFGLFSLLAAKILLDLGIIPLPLLRLSFGHPIQFLNFLVELITEIVKIFLGLPSALVD